ncbi:unnamed protein product, partial [Mesorhabditis belari]|uniref:POU-specific domain-containing protein n=1 Tax=Mesorhabditis belari TaxID=2138241 RepID=A0AAF3ESX1_9BILA
MADIYALPEPINGEIFGHKLEDLEEALKLLTEADMKKLDELEKFAMFFKNARVNFGFTQLDVGHALGPRYGAEFSQTTISRFEACNLSFKNMCKLQPILEQWICETEKALLNGTSVGAIVELGTSRKSITDDEDSPMKR